MLTGSVAKLSVVKTDAAGNWSIDLHPADVEGMQAVVATPDVGIPNDTGGRAVDAAEATSCRALIVAGEGR